jgi:hypothetical protein
MEGKVRKERGNKNKIKGKCIDFSSHLFGGKKNGKNIHIF